MQKSDSEEVPVEEQEILFRYLKRTDYEIFMSDFYS